MDNDAITEEQIDAEVQADIMTDEDKVAMMNNDDADTLEDNTITQTDSAMTVWLYEAYSLANAQSALSAGKEVVLFFHASRCSSCRSLDKDITTNKLPDNTVVFKIDYDNSTDLKKKYGVTTQHTLIRIDTDLSIIDKNIGGTFTDLVNLF